MRHAARIDARSTRQQADLAEANYQTALLDLRRQMNIPPDSPIELAGDLAALRWKTAHQAALEEDDRVALRNELGRFEGRVLLAPIARGNLQIHWPEANTLIRRGVTDPAGGVPDYNARVTVEKIGSVKS